jgi:hypothetical protein
LSDDNPSVGTHPKSESQSIGCSDGIRSVRSPNLSAGDEKGGEGWNNSADEGSESLWKSRAFSMGLIDGKLSAIVIITAGIGRFKLGEHPNAKILISNLTCEHAEDSKII